MTHKETLMPDGWGEVDTVYRTCATRLSACSIVIPVMELFEKRTDLLNANPTVMKACKSLMADVPTLRQELDTIAQKHANKQGDINSSDELLLTIDIGQQYQSWLDRFERLVDANLNTVANYIEHINNEQPVK